MSSGHDYERALIYNLPLSRHPKEDGMGFLIDRGSSQGFFLMSLRELFLATVASGLEEHLYNTLSTVHIVHDSYGRTLLIPQWGNLIVTTEKNNRSKLLLHADQGLLIEPDTTNGFFLILSVHIYI